MDFSLSKEQEEIQAEAAAMAAELPSDLVEKDRQSTFDAEAWRRLADKRFLHGFAPEEFGGRGWNVLTRVLALEAFGKGCRDNGLCLALSALAWTIIPPILAMGSEEQKRRYLPRLLSGKCFAADAITEEGAGSDVMAMETTARRSDDGYLINGRKCCIGFAPIADLILLFAKTDPEAGPWGISAFLIESDVPGIQRSDNVEKMGLRTVPMGSLVFHDCRAPKAALLGDEGTGLSLFNESMEWERCFILATQVGAMARQLDECVAYAKQRKQFGRPIGEQQSVSNRIADMRSRLESCRLMLYHCAWLKDRGKSAALQAAMAKLAISESFAASSLDAVRIHGSKGYLTAFQIERDLRDATGGLIYAGTSDIQRNLIARLSGL